MALLPADSIKVIAESLGIPNLSDEIAKALAPDIEYRIREIAQESLKFMRHAKREVLTTEDVNSALRLRNVEALYGFTANSDPLNFCRAVGTNDLYFIDDKEVDFADVISAALPACPRDVSLQLHWLAIEGVQPAIPQNPSTEVVAKKRKPATPLEKNPEIKPIVKHVISRELQLYYEKITEAIKGDDQELRVAALGSLANDPGLHQLVPYFCQFISDETTKNLRKTKLLLSLMQMIRALLDSPHIHIEPYVQRPAMLTPPSTGSRFCLLNSLQLHQLMPSILTCLVGKRLNENNDPPTHWELRDYAAGLVAHICKMWGEAYTTLQPRITKTLVHAWLDSSKPLATHYGAIKGLTGLGRHTIQLLLLPNLAMYCKCVAPETHSADPTRQMEAKKIMDALMQAAVIIIRGAIEDSKAPAAAKKDAASLPAAAASLVGNNDPAKLHKEMRELFGAELDAALKEKEKEKEK